MKLEELVETVKGFYDDPHEKFERTHWMVIDFESKTKFVNGIAKVLKEQELLSIGNVELKFFVNKKYLKEKRRVIEEYVVITYNNGEIAVANNEANSLSATYRNIGMMLNGGYYKEVPAYNEILNDSDYEEVEVE